MADDDKFRVIGFSGYGRNSAKQVAPDGCLSSARTGPGEKFSFLPTQLGQYDVFTLETVPSQTLDIIFYLI